MEDLTGQVNAVDNISDAEWNSFYQEFKNFLTDMFITMSVGDLNQLHKGIAMLASRQNFQTGGGAANAYTTTQMAGTRAPGSYQNGQLLIFRPTAANTGASTVNMNSEGVKTITREDGTALVANDLVTTRDAWLRYDSGGGGTFKLANFALGAPSQALPDGFRHLMTMGRNSGDLLHDVTITVGSARDTTNAANLVLSSAWTKQFDASVALGDNAGGYPLTTLGARASDTWHRFFVIGHTDGRIEAGWDSMANADASALLTDFNTADGAPGSWLYYKQIGFSKTKAVATNLREIANADEDPGLFRLEDCGGYFVDNIATPKVQTSLAVADCPPGAVALIHVGFENDTGGILDQHYGYILDTESGDPIPTRASHNAGSTTASETTEDKFTNLVEVKVDASGNIFHRWANVGGSEIELYMRVMSFRWEN